MADGHGGTPGSGHLPMPELPEVETTRAGLAARLEGRRVVRVQVREPRLRWPVPETLGQRLTGACLEHIGRRAKYLLFHFDRGVLLGHLGMSGSMRLVDPAAVWLRHDHIACTFEGCCELRLNDPRRFGSLHWIRPEELLKHFLIARLGPEPLGDGFNGACLHERASRRRVPVKTFLMDAHVVAGVGNIYANEALFRAGIHPLREAGRIARPRYDRLADAIRDVLGEAVAMGGTTLRDFVGSDGRPGYFRQSLDVYGRGGEPCRRCGRLLKQLRLVQRATVYCSRCQR